MRSLFQAIRLRWVQLGTFATFMILLGSLTPAYLPQNSPWWRYVRALHLDGLPGKLGGTLLVLAGLTLLTQAWLGMRESVYEGVKHWAVLAWWSLPLVFGPPVFSHDAYSYAAQGWLIHNNLNPYEVGPGVLPGAFADQTPWVWRFTPTPYGPLSLVIQWGIVEATHLQPYLSAVFMRIPALMGVALIVAFIPRIAREMRVDVQFTAWFAMLNPILITDFVGGAHNDAHMTGLVVLAIWLAFRRRYLVGAALIGVAAAIKQPALLAAFAIAFIGRPVPDLRNWRIVRKGMWRVLLSMGMAIGVFSGISWVLGYGFGWLNAVNVPGSVLTISPTTVVGQGIQIVLNRLGLDPSGHAALTGTRSVGLLALVVLVMTLALTVARTKPITFLSWSYLAVALMLPALHGWYMLWGGVLLPLTKPGPKVIRIAVWTSVLLLSYAAVNLSWRNGSTALGVATIALFMWQATHYHRRQRDYGLDGLIPRTAQGDL